MADKRFWRAPDKGPGESDATWRHERKGSVTAALRQNGPALQDASEAQKNDKEFVTAAVEQDGRALQHASADLKKDKVVVMVSVQQDGWALKYASEALRGDKNVVKAAVQNDGRALKHASAALKSDEEVVAAAVQQNGWALEYASDAQKKNKEVVLYAVQQNRRALEYASEALQGDKEVVTAAVRKNGWALQHATETLKNDKEVVMVAVKQAWWALEYASAGLKDDRDIVMAAVQQDGRALRFASKGLKNDKKFVEDAVRWDVRALQYASGALQALGIAVFMSLIEEEDKLLVPGNQVILTSVPAECTENCSNSSPCAECLQPGRTAVRPGCTGRTVLPGLQRSDFYVAEFIDYQDEASPGPSKDGLKVKLRLKGNSKRDGTFDPYRAKHLNAWKVKVGARDRRVMFTSVKDPDPDKRYEPLEVTVRTEELLPTYAFRERSRDHSLYAFNLNRKQSIPSQVQRNISALLKMRKKKA